MRSVWISTTGTRGMNFLRGLGRWSGVCVALGMLAPDLALVAAAVVDRGPAGGPRVAVFPFALAAWDPFLWQCVRNSAAGAAVVAAGSLVLGVGLAGLVVRRRFWG